MASVILDFTPLPGYTKLHIYEASTKEDAPGLSIETVDVDPASPPTRYTTNQATSSTNWFSIQWEDDKGGLSPMSEPVQGGTSTVVGDVVNRVLLRDVTLDEQIVTQISEWVVGRVFKVDDPYSVTIVPSLRQMEGMTLLALARAHVHSMMQSASSSDSYTAGLVSQKSDSGKQTSNLRDLIKMLTDEANILLGINNSFVMVMEDFDPTGLGTSSSINWDHSRQAVTINYE